MIGKGIKANDERTNLVHQLRLVERSYPFVRVGEFDQLGIEDRPWLIGIGWQFFHHRLYRLYHLKTFLDMLKRWSSLRKCVEGLGV